MRHYLSVMLLRENGTYLSSRTKTIRSLFATPLYWITRFTSGDAFAYLGMSTDCFHEQHQLHPDCRLGKSVFSIAPKEPVHSDQTSNQCLQEVYRGDLKVLAARVEKSGRPKPLIRQQAPQEFQEEVIKINRIIDRYIFRAPALHLQSRHRNTDQFLNQIRTSRVTHTKKRNPRHTPPPTSTVTDSESQTLDDEDDSINRTTKPKQSPKPLSQSDGMESGNLWDPRYLAEITRDFYRELARAYVSMMRGFKNHR